MDIACAWTDVKPWGSVGERDGSVDIACAWTDVKPWEIAWEEFRWGARRKRGHCMCVDGCETVGNSLGRAPLGSVTEAWTLHVRQRGRDGSVDIACAWTDVKPWEIAWEELRWGARRKRGHCMCVNGGETEAWTLHVRGRM